LLLTEKRKRMTDLRHRSFVRAVEVFVACSCMGAGATVVVVTSAGKAAEVAEAYSTLGSSRSTVTGWNLSYYTYVSDRARSSLHEIIDIRFDRLR